jgi:alpha 1,3-glucosidase
MAAQTDAHIDTKRHELFLFEQPYKGIIKDILRLRYTMLSVLLPHYVMFPKEPKGFAVDDQYFISTSGILVKPIMT